MNNNGRAIGLVELTSIATGIEAADQMLKVSSVNILLSRSVCPGKFIVLIEGDVAAVENSIDAGKNVASQFYIDDFILPNAHPSIFSAITGTNAPPKEGALGVIETYTVSGGIVAADSAVKAADVVLVEVKIAMAISGKSYVVLAGNVAAVESAVNVGTAAAREKGMVVSSVVIPSPHKDLYYSIL